MENAFSQNQSLKKSSKIDVYFHNETKRWIHLKWSEMLANHCWFQIQKIENFVVVNGNQRGLYQNCAGSPDWIWINVAIWGKYISYQNIHRKALVHFDKWKSLKSRSFLLISVWKWQCGHIPKWFHVFDANVCLISIIASEAAPNTKAPEMNLVLSWNVI